LKSLFAFLRTFEANAVGIFGKFEGFAKGFIDAGKARISERNRFFLLERRAASAAFNRVFTMIARARDRSAARRASP
jgi:hypothetical protein